jgi:tetratricopeptide (TPR) repeat protein
MGCLIFLDNSPEIRNLGCTLLASASEANYNPSTITLARLLLRSGNWGSSRSSTHLQKRFMKLVFEGKDCNALAVYGEHLFMARKYAAAVPMLNQAISVDDGIFEWRRMCMRYLAKAYAQLGKIKEAENVLEKLGDPDAWIELGPLLDRGGFEDTRQWLYREGYEGRLEEFRKLAEMDFEKASKETDKALKHEYNLWAMEWSRLADPSVEN